MHITDILDAQVHAVNEVVVFFCQLAIKVEEWRYNHGLVQYPEYMHLKTHIGWYMTGINELTACVLIGVTALYIFFVMPRVAGFYAVKMSNLKVKLGLKRKLWVFDPSSQRERQMEVPSEYLSYSSVSAAKRGRAFEDTSKLSDFELETAPPSVGMLRDSYRFGVRIGHAIQLYLGFFSVYYLCFGDSQWMHHIQAWNWVL